MEELVCSIERMREALHKIAASKGLGHPDVLTASKVLDQAISKYLRSREKMKSGNASGDNDHHLSKR